MDRGGRAAGARGAEHQERADGNECQDSGGSLCSPPRPPFPPARAEHHRRAHLLCRSKLHPRLAIQPRPWYAAVARTRIRVAARPQELQGHEETLRVVGAFVTFKEEAGKAAALQALPRSFVRQMLMPKEHKLRERWGHWRGTRGERQGWLESCTLHRPRQSKAPAGCWEA